MPCDQIDVSIKCTADDPVWIPDPATRGVGGQKRSLFRDAVFPLPSVPHANKGTLKGADGRLVGAPYFFMLPRARALYTRAPDAKPHALACSSRYCLHPDVLLRAFSSPSRQPRGRAPRTCTT